MAIMAVHMLGNPCDMGKLQEIATQHNLLLIRHLHFRTMHIVKLSTAQLYQSEDAIRW